MTTPDVAKTKPCRFDDNCIGHPEMPDGWTSWQEALHADDNGQVFRAWFNTEPVIRAETRGHTVEFDAPAAMTKGRRWTCTECGSAVLIYHTNIYGSAVERDCNGGSR